MAVGIPALNQEKMRRHQFATDQHGRKYSFYVDIKSGGACTPFSPQFRAPWYPPNDRIRIDRERPGALLIEYDTLILELKDAAVAYRHLMIRAANHFNVPNWNPDRDPPTAQMRNDIGSPPLPVEPVLAAKAGNGFILGLRPYDARRPGDVKLAAALVAWTAPPRGMDALADEELDEFADDVAATVAVVEAAEGDEGHTRGRKRSRQPVG